MTLDTQGQITQGQNFYQGGRNIGTVQFDPQTGRRLNAGEVTHTLSPVSTTFNAENHTSPITPSNVPSPSITTGADGINGYIDSLTDSINKENANVEDLKQTTATAKQNLYDKIFGSKGKEELTNEEYTNSVDPSKKELDDINNQISAKKEANNHEIEAIQNETGITKEQANIKIAETNRKNAAEMADLSIQQQAKNKNYTTAKEIADRKVAMETEQEQKNIDALKQYYNDNKGDLTKAEDRQYNLMISERTRALNEQQTNAKAISTQVIDAIKAGAPSDIATKMQKAGSPEEAATIGQDYLQKTTTRSVGGEVVKLDAQGNVIKNIGPSSKGAVGKSANPKDDVNTNFNGAGVSKNDFTKLDPKVQDFYKNITPIERTAINKSFANVKNGKLSYDDAKSAIDSSNNPPEVKAQLLDRLNKLTNKSSDATATSTTSGGIKSTVGGWWDKLKSYFQ